MLRRLVCVVLLAPALAGAQGPDSTTLAALRWRQIGPANMMGRVADIEGIGYPSRTFFVAAAAGGVWKTINNGTTFRPVFDNYGVASLGDLAIARSDTNVLYLGTGEPNARNSHSPGAGVFKSTNGGLSWSFMGLKETQNIGRIQVDPRDANVAYVAAMGHSWGANKERGLYKTTDGGRSWTNIKYVDERTGAIDVQLNPKNPDEVWVAMYERVRGPYFLKSGGPGSGIFKSLDAGKTWTAVQGGGLPETTLGRVNIAFAPSNPAIMYLMVEADTAPRPLAKGARPDPTVPTVKAQKSPSGLYRSEDGGKTWTRTNEENTRPFYYSQVRVHPTKPNRVYWSSTPVKFSDDGGKTARNATNGIHVDHHAMWFDPNDPEHLIVGNDGGIAQSWDGGGTYDFMNQFVLAQPYNLSFDMQVPYRVCAGLQDNGSWCGPSRRKNGPITNAMWFTYAGGDGFVTAQDPTDPNIIYGESQGGNISRYNHATGESTFLVKPSWRPRYTQWEDSILVERPDTTAPVTKEQKARVARFRAQQKADSMAYDLRWNWNTPFFLSKHNPAVFYAAANRVLKSTKRGDDLYFISGDLTYADTTKIRISTKTTGGITIDATGAETFGTIVSLNESAIRPGVLYAGTDDGRVWVTADDGGRWQEVTASIKGVPAGSYVSRIEPSKFDSLTFWVTYDNHRRDDFRPYVFVTNDFGRTFRSIVNDLPADPTSPNFVHVLREDTRNPDLLFVGTDVAAYVSTDRGAHWTPFMTGLPNVPVHDLQIHPRDGELMAATHGRGIYIVDINPLQQMTAAAAGAEAVLFKPRTAHQYGEGRVNGESAGHKLFQAPSPAYGADLWYRLTKPAGGQVRIVIQDASGDTIRTVNGPGQPGLHLVTWAFQGKAAPAAKLSPAGVRDSIVTARKIAAALDSLEKEGTMPKPMLDRVRTAMAGGQAGMMEMMQQFGGFGGGGRGPGGGPARWNDRPGETAGGGRGQGEGAAAGAEAPDAGGMANLFQALQRALPPGALGFGGGGRRGGGGGIAEPGTYKVSMTVGGKTYTQLLKVERINGEGGMGFSFDDEDGQEP